MNPINRRAPLRVRSTKSNNRGTQVKKRCQTEPSKTKLPYEQNRTIKHPRLFTEIESVKKTRKKNNCR